MQTPAYYLPIMPYLVIGEASQFLTFLSLVFKAKVELLIPRENGTVMHAEVSIAKAVILLAEATESYLPMPGSMFLLIDNLDEVYETALSYGAISLQAVADRDYGRSAGFQDPFGNHWWLNKPQ